MRGGCVVHRPQNAPLVRVLLLEGGWVCASCFGGRSELGLFQTAGPFVGLAPARFLSILRPAFAVRLWLLAARRDSPGTAFIAPRPVTTPAPLASEASKPSRRLLRGGIPSFPLYRIRRTPRICPKPAFLLLDCPTVLAAAR